MECWKIFGNQGKPVALMIVSPSVKRSALHFEEVMTVRRNSLSSRTSKPHIYRARILKSLDVYRGQQYKTNASASAREEATGLRNLMKHLVSTARYMTLPYPVPKAQLIESPEEWNHLSLTTSKRPQQDRT